MKTLPRVAGLAFFVREARTVVPPPRQARSLFFRPLLQQHLVGVSGAA